mgnify:FL=1
MLFRSRVFTATAQKVVKPLTKAMKEGKEPLRTFGDLKQFLSGRGEEPAGLDAPPADGDPQQPSG